MDAPTIPRWSPGFTLAQVDAIPLYLREEARMRVEARAAGYRQRCANLAEVFSSNQPRRHPAESDESWRGRLEAYEAWQLAVCRGEDRRVKNALLARALP